MGCESSDDVRFDLGSLFQGQTRIANFKSAYNSFIIGLEVSTVKPTCRKSWTVNHLMWSDLTLGPLLQGQKRIAKLKSAYNSLIIGPRGLQCETNV